MSSTLKFGKAVGFSIPISLLKLLCEYISIPLCEIINESSISGIFPDPLKLAKVISLYKKQSPGARSEFLGEGWQAVFLVGGVTVMEKREIMVGWVTKVCLKCAKKLG